jgi:hypothetical protein
MSGHKSRVSRESRVTFSDFTGLARPLVRGVADTCKDLGVIGGTVYAGYELLYRILTALLRYLPFHST